MAETTNSAEDKSKDVTSLESTETTENKADNTEIKPEHSASKKQSGKNDKPSIGARISGWFKGMKAEFKKIIWPDHQTWYRQTAVSILLAAVLTLAIALIDALMTWGINAFI